jgi:hypothetical protein
VARRGEHLSPLRGPNLAFKSSSRVGRRCRKLCRSAPKDTKDDKVNVQVNVQAQSTLPFTLVVHPVLSFVDFVGNRSPKPFRENNGNKFDKAQDEACDIRSPGLSALRSGTHRGEPLGLRSRPDSVYWMLLVDVVLMHFLTLPGGPRPLRLRHVPTTSTAVRPTERPARNMLRSTRGMVMASFGMAIL